MYGVIHFIESKEHTKEYERKTKEPFVMVQIRVSKEERRKLRMVCAELGVSLQEFVRKLLRGSLG